MLGICQQYVGNKRSIKMSNLIQISHWSQMGFKVDILTTSVNIKIGYERNANNFLKEWMQKGLSYTGKIEIMYIVYDKRYTILIFYSIVLSNRIFFISTCMTSRKYDTLLSSSWQISKTQKRFFKIQSKKMTYL